MDVRKYVLAKEKVVKNHKNITLLDTIANAREAKEHRVNLNILWAY